MKTLTAGQYYLALAYFIVACQAQAEVRKFAEKLLKITGSDYIIDDVYNPEMTGTKEEFDNVLRNRDVQVDWFAEDKKENKIKKQKEGEQNESK